MPINKKNILIVDDESGVREILHEFLSDLGVNIVEAENGRQAWDFLKNNKVDLVLTDIQMPLMSGLELCQKIYEEKMPTSTIIVTGYGGTKECLTAMKFGVFDLIEKPFEKEIIIVRVKNVLEKQNVIIAMNETFGLLAQALNLKIDCDFIRMSSQEQINILGKIAGFASVRLQRTSTVDSKT